MEQPVHSVGNNVRGELGPLPTSRPQPGPAPFTRQKRRQVARACDECRTYRIKCDNGNPCANCSRKARTCSNGISESPASLAVAAKQMSDLESRIRQLQEELQSERENATQVHNQLTPPDSSTSRDGTSSRESYTTPKTVPSHGVSLRPPRSPNDTWLGPSSLYYFVTRLARPLGSLSHHSPSTDSLTTNPEETKGLLGEPGPTGAAEETTQLMELLTISTWNAMQEQYFTDRYWESYHTGVTPILNEAEFKAHHLSLWSNHDKPRKMSALVDIVIAISMQLGVPANNAGQNKPGEVGTDRAVAGHRYYRRCQALLAYQMESPTMATLQCYLLCSTYLCAGSFHNMVDATVALAVRTAYMLGLHLDPPESMALREKEERRRLWWATYVMDTRISMKLGRPFGIDDTHSMPELPGHGLETAALSGSHFAPVGPQVTWLSFNRRQVELYKVFRGAYIVFFRTCGAIRGDQNIWGDTGTLEACAESLLSHSHRLNNWVDSVPTALRTKRRDGGTPFSTDGTAVEVEPFAPLWLQRQCLLLEMTYHHWSINLFRPLISFYATPKPGGLAGEFTNRCASHAIAFTKITHQVITKEDILEGWYEVFCWQWNSAMTLVGFVLADPLGSKSEMTKNARQAIVLAVVVCERFGISFKVAARAAHIIRHLGVKLDLIISKREATTQDVWQVSTGLNTEDDNILASGGPLSSTEFSMFDASTVGDGWNMNSDQELFNVVLAVDFWNDMNAWWPDAHMQM